MKQRSQEIFNKNDELKVIVLTKRLIKHTMKLTNNSERYPKKSTIYSCWPNAEDRYWNIQAFNESQLFKYQYKSPIRQTAALPIWSGLYVWYSLTLYWTFAWWKLHKRQKLWILGQTGYGCKKNDTVLEECRQ